MDTIADFDSKSSQSQKSEPELSSQQDDDSSESSQIDKDPCEKSDPMCFEETLIDGQMFCIIPRFLVKYVPTSLVADHFLDGVGPVQVGKNLRTSLWSKLQNLPKPLL